MLVLRAGDTGVDQLGLRAVELGLRGDDIGFRRHAELCLVGRDAQRTLIRRHGIAQQPRQLVLIAELEIQRCQRRLAGQAGIRQIGGERLGRGGTALHAAADAAPHIQIPACLCLHVVAVVGETAGLAAGDAGAGAQRGKQSGTGLCDQGDGLAIGGFGLCDGLVVDRVACFQRAQRRVVENGPPGAAAGAVGGLGGGPAFLEGEGHGGGGADVVWADLAGGEEGGEDQGKARGSARQGGPRSADRGGVPVERGGQNPRPCRVLHCATPSRAGRPAVFIHALNRSR